VYKIVILFIFILVFKKIRVLSKEKKWHFWHTLVV
jgi:hypothetical protein